MDSPVLRLRDFGVAFNERVVLRGVDLDVPARGVTLLVGPAAGGKSTLLRALAGLLAPRPELRTWGEAVYLGRPLDADPTAPRPAIVGQKARLMTASILENLIHTHPRRSQLTTVEQRKIVREMTAAAGLPQLGDRLDDPVVELPIGWQRRLAIVRAAAAKPALLCTDEPTAELPDDEIDAILGLLAKFARSRAVLMVTHNQAHAQTLGGWTALLVGGRVVEAAPTARFFANPSTGSGKQFVRTGSCSMNPADDEPNAGPAPSFDEPVAEPTRSPAIELAVLAGPVADESRIDPPGREERESSADASPVSEDARESPSEAASNVAPESNAPSDAFQGYRRGVGPRGFVWLWSGRLGGTPRPGLLRDLDDELELLRDLGVTALVCLTEELPPVDEPVLRRFGMQGVWCPMPDMGVPTIDECWRLCKRIGDLLASGAVVAVHCKAGLGRTGTILAAQLIYQERRSALDALETVRRYEPRWVQSQAQVDFLSAFAAHAARQPPPDRGDPAKR